MTTKSRMKFLSTSVIEQKLKPKTFLFNETKETCNSLTEEGNSFPVFYTFLKEDGVLLADVLERCLFADLNLIPNVQVVCGQCYSLIEDYAELEWKIKELRNKLWDSFKAATQRRKNDVYSYIRANSTQTDTSFLETYVDSEKSEDRKLRELLSHSESKVTRSSKSTQNNKINEFITSFSNEIEDSFNDNSSNPDTALTEEADNGKSQELTVDVDPYIALTERNKKAWGKNAPQRPAVCKVCGKWFKTQVEVNRHLTDQKSIEPGEINVDCIPMEDQATYQKCSLCLKVFDCRKDFKRHFSKDHKSQKITYECRICDKTLGSKHGALYHGKCHEVNINSSFDIEKAFNISFVPNGDDDDQPTTAAMDFEGHYSSSDDEVPLAAKKDQIMMQKDDFSLDFENIKMKTIKIIDSVDIPSTHDSETVESSFSNESPKGTQIIGGGDMKINPTDILDYRKKKNTSPLKMKRAPRIKRTVKKLLKPRIIDLSSFAEERDVGSDDTQMVNMEDGDTADKMTPRKMKKFSLIKNDENNTDEFVLPLIREPKLKCETCGKLWRTKGELNAHKLSHSDNRPYICEICGQPYKHKNALEVHISMHKGIYQYQCPYCQKAFTQKGALRRHMPIHTGEFPYQCELCGKRFVHRTSFSIHTIAHTGVRKIKCEVCNIGVLSKSHLRRHMRIHSGEKPYECEICRKTFAERYNLVAHQRIHDPNPQDKKPTKRKPLKICLICGFVCPTRIKLEEHMMQEHESPILGHKTDSYDSSEAFLNQSRYGINTATSSKVEYEEEVKTEVILDVPSSKRSSLAGMEILKSADGSLVRLASGNTQHWSYVPSTS